MSKSTTGQDVVLPPLRLVTIHEVSLLTNPNPNPHLYPHPYPNHCSPIASLAHRCFRPANSFAASHWHSLTPLLILTYSHLQNPTLTLTLTLTRTPG